MSVFNSNYRPFSFANPYLRPSALSPFGSRTGAALGLATPVTPPHPVLTRPPSLFAASSGAAENKLADIMVARPAASERGPRAFTLDARMERPSIAEARGGILPSLEGSTWSTSGTVRGRTGDELGLSASGPSFEVGDSGIQASIVSAKATGAADVLGGRASFGAEVGLDASTHVWTGQNGKWGAEFAGIGAWVQRTREGNNCAGLGTTVLEGNACASNGFFSSIASFFKSLW